MVNGGIMISFFVALVRFANALRVGFRDPEFKGLVAFVLIILASGTFFYSQIEGWRLIDALYFSVTTLITVGYGDLTPKTDLGKLFTIVYLFTGVGVILGFINIVAHHASNQNPVKGFFSDSSKSSPKEEQKNSKSED
jgi:voltage-gated potassium channel